MSNWKNVSLRFKVSLLGLGGVIVAALALLLIASLSSGAYNATAEDKVRDVSQQHLESITQGIANMVQVQGESIQQQVDAALRVAQYVLTQTGEISLSNQTTSWKTVNQLTQETSYAQLPQMLVGGRWLGQNANRAVETPVVDEIVRLVGGTATIFQRMNDEGDMLRIATTVPTADGRRAIGTYIPKTNPDGTPNLVLAAVLAGETYHGRAFVVNTWYITAYQPFYDKSGRVIGMLYVGVEQERAASVRKIIQRTHWGKQGAVYVLAGQGEARGNYIISPDGQHDGQSAWDMQDADGNLVIQSIITQALALRPDPEQPDQVPISEEPWRYRLPSPDGQPPRWRLAEYAYYETWDWVIVMEADEQEVQAYETTLRDGRTRMLATLGTAGLTIAVAVGFVGFAVTRVITRPLKDLAGVAERISNGETNLDAPSNVHGEVGTLARAFNSMTGRLRQMIADLEQRVSAEQVAVQRYVEQMAMVGKGHLAARVAIGEEGISPALATLGNSLNQMTDDLQQIIAGIRSAADSLGAATSEILASTAQQANGATEQSAAIIQTSTTIDEVQSIATQTAQRAQGVAETAQRTNEIAQAGQEAVAQAVSSIDGIRTRIEAIAQNILSLSEQAQAIGQIVATVNEVATQSNMLALNAAVEAARAGEAGKGFAVVAGEVRALAEQSRAATVQVREILSDIQRGVNTSVMATEEAIKEMVAGTRVTGEAGLSIRRLAESVGESVQAATQIAAAAGQQQAGVEQIALAMRNIQQVTSQTVEGTRRSEQAAEELNQLAEKLRQVVQQYQL